MLKQRIIATLIIKNNIVVQSIGFKKYRPIGRVDIAIEYLNQWGIDEIILLDIDATKNANYINPQLVQNASKSCFVPLCVGGGISNIKQIKKLLENGADKVSINHAFLHQCDFIKDAVSIFGSQCILLCLDIIKEKNVFMVYDYTTNKTVDSLENYLEKAIEYNIGEVILHSVHRDGQKVGLDEELIDFATSTCKIPILILGGAADAKDLFNALTNPLLSAVCAANFFHYFEHSVNISKAYIKSQNNFPIRHDNYISYSEFNFDDTKRVSKNSDLYLSNLLYEKQEEEIL